MIDFWPTFATKGQARFTVNISTRNGIGIRECRCAARKEGTLSGTGQDRRQGGEFGQGDGPEVEMSEKHFSPTQMKQWLEDVRAMYPKIRIGILEKPERRVLVSASSITITSVATEVLDAEDGLEDLSNDA